MRSMNLAGAARTDVESDKALWMLLRGLPKPLTKSTPLRSIVWHSAMRQGAALRWI